MAYIENMTAGGWVDQGPNRINSTENTTGDFRQDQHAGGGEENSLSTVDLHAHDRNAELHVRRS